jgi:hypothetical protein
MYLTCKSRQNHGSLRAYVEACKHVFRIFDKVRACRMINSSRDFRNPSLESEDDVFFIICLLAFDNARQNGRNRRCVERKRIQEGVSATELHIATSCAFRGKWRKIIPPDTAASSPTRGGCSFCATYRQLRSRAVANKVPRLMFN